MTRKASAFRGQMTSQKNVGILNVGGTDLFFTIEMEVEVLRYWISTVQKAYFVG